MHNFNIYGFDLNCGFGLSIWVTKNEVGGRITSPLYDHKKNTILYKSLIHLNNSKQIQLYSILNSIPYILYSIYLNIKYIYTNKIYLSIFFLIPKNNSNYNLYIIINIEYQSELISSSNYSIQIFPNHQLILYFKQINYH